MRLLSVQCPLDEYHLFSLPAPPLSSTPLISERGRDPLGDNYAADSHANSLYLATKHT